MPRRKRIGPSPHKARIMLEENRANGRPLTPKQKKLFRAIEHGFVPTGRPAKRRRR